MVFFFIRRQRPTLKPSMEIVSKAQEFADIYRHPAVRPAPIYPTPTVDKPAAKCRKDVCLLPDCSCGGSDIPGKSSFIYYVFLVFFFFPPLFFLALIFFFETVLRD